MRFVPSSGPPPPPPGEIIVDNGGTGTSSTGTWIPSSGANYYGTQSVYSDQAGATYSFEAAVNGDYEFSMRWTYFNNRCPNVPVRIYNGSTLIDTVWVDQLQNPATWLSLGTYSFTGTARVVLLSQDTCTTNADAVRFVP